MNSIIRKIFMHESNSLIVQFFRYGIVGGIASAVDISVFYIAVNLADINHLIANTLSFSFGLIVNYFLSREWVFNKKKHNARKDFLLFAVIGVLGLLLSNLILFILIDCNVLYKLLPVLDSNLTKLTAKLIAVFVVLFWNFIARKKIVFNIG